MSFPRYPKYKPSGVEWLGEVPEHWNVLRIANMFREVAEPGTDDLPILSVSIHDGVSDAELSDTEMDRKVTRSDDRSKYKRVKPGDLVYNMMRAWQGGFGTVAVDGMVSPAYVVARPFVPMRTSFIEQQFRTPHAVEQMRRESQGVTDFRLRLYWDAFKNMHVVVPPYVEQSAIAAFLDRETAKIDALVAEQERLIELLAEKRQAVISHAVTKGLDPAAPMKPSGVEWLGNVPAHWEVVALRHLVDCLDGRRIPLNAEERASRTGDVPYWGANCVVDYVDKALLDEPVVLLGEDGAPFFDKPKPVAFHVNGPIWPNNHVHVLRPLERLEGTYLTHALNVTDYAAFIQGSTRDKLTQGAMNAIPVPVPPRSEQAAIANRLAKHEDQSAGLIAQSIRAVGLLQERRSALISAAVTGQIDVRHAVPEGAA